MGTDRPTIVCGKVLWHNSVVYKGRRIVPTTLKTTCTACKRGRGKWEHINGRELLYTEPADFPMNENVSCAQRMVPIYKLCAGKAGATVNRQVFWYCNWRNFRDKLTGFGVGKFLNYDRYFRVWPLDGALMYNFVRFFINWALISWLLSLWFVSFCDKNWGLFNFCLQLFLNFFPYTFRAYFSFSFWVSVFTVS